MRQRAAERLGHDGNAVGGEVQHLQGAQVQAAVEGAHGVARRAQLGELRRWQPRVCNPVCKGPIIKAMLRDWGVSKSGIIYADSSSALAIAKRKGAGKLRHIHVSLLGLQQKKDHELEFRTMLGTENRAYLMTIFWRG